MPVRQLHAAAYACAERVRMGWFKRVRRMVCACLQSLGRQRTQNYSAHTAGAGA